MKQKPELLAPAGDWECLRAAVANGADCVYFGLPSFNARMRADNFTEEDLPAVMKYLHARGRKGYVAFNVLIFTGELAEAARCLALLERTGVDAVIIQDVGLASLARSLCPGLRVHASTQMTITSPEGVRFARRLGAVQVVLARELSLRELAKFREEEREEPMPLEVFVHGALCVAYSGQCLTSEALGQRSANRGECAQACRMPYDLWVDGKARDLGDRRYLLSPQDLAAADDIPALISLGIRSFKIEGRLKSPEYVAAVTKVYRRVIDDAWNNRPEPLRAQERYELEMTFSRGFFNGWMDGVNHQKLVHARFGKKRGPFVGTVAEVGRDYVSVRAEVALLPGDGVVFDTGEDTNREQGGRIYQIQGDRLYFQHGKINFARIAPGTRIWKTDDPRLKRDLQKTYAADPPIVRRTIDWTLLGRVGEPLHVRAVCDDCAVEGVSEVVLQEAREHPLDADKVGAQLSRLGDTPFQHGRVDWQVEGRVILPLKELNRLRRDAVVRLSEKINVGARPVSAEPRIGVLTAKLAAISARRTSVEGRPVSLQVLCRNLEQIEAALESGTSLLYADFEDIRRYKDAVTRVREQSGARLYLATPRIQKAGEEGFFRLIANAKPDGVLVRNLGGLAWFREAGLPMVGDFSLNVANPLTAGYLMDEGLEAVTVSYDLNIRQVLDLLAAAPPEWFEMTIHQHMPMFHMEHCVFAAFLSEGTDHTNCGRPCDRHAVSLRDRVGLEHPVKADVGCRNTVFHGKAQSGAVFSPEILAAGLRRFRVELLQENKEEAVRVIRSYQELLAGRLTGDDLVRELRLRSQLGVTLGTLEVKPARPAGVEP
jgi:putative protease